MWIWLNAEEEAGPDDEAGIKLTEYRKEGNHENKEEQAEEVPIFNYFEFWFIYLSKMGLLCIVWLRMQAQKLRLAYN